MFKRYKNKMTTIYLNFKRNLEDIDAINIYCIQTISIYN